MTQCEGHWNLNRNVWNLLSPAAVPTVYIDSLLYIVALRGCCTVTLLLHTCNMRFFKQTFVCNSDLCIATSCGPIPNFADCYVLNCISQPVMLCVPEHATDFISAFSYLKPWVIWKFHQDCHRQLLVTRVIGLPPQCRWSLHSSGMLCCKETWVAKPQI